MTQTRSVRSPHYEISLRLQQSKVLSVQGKVQKYIKMLPVSNMTAPLWYVLKNI